MTRAASSVRALSTVPERSAVVFAYHTVGARCLRVLLARGVHVSLVVTHDDHPAELIWFESVRAVAEEFGIPCITPQSADEAGLAERIGALRPDFIFSFYYRQMIPVALLSLAKDGAFNMHGSLLPRYRGRVPVNWAVLHGESETGATLHEMVAKPDAGAIVAQVAVPILPDDTAHEVFNKVAVAAEQALWGVLPSLLTGHAPRLPNDLASGSYFGGRKPEDGRIDWTQPAAAVYDLIRAVAPPYPGAFCDHAGLRLVVAAARPLRNPGRSLGEAGQSDERSCSHPAGSDPKDLTTRLGKFPPGMHVVDNAVFGVCGDGRVLRLLRLLRDSAQGPEIDAEALAATS